MNDLAVSIWEWCKSRYIWITAVHIQGRENIIADEKSRAFDDNTEWSLNEKVFQFIVDNWRVPSVDLFASRLRHKVPECFSLEPDPASQGVDSL